uniref:Transcription factor 24 n=1 Tax=Erpetoichthys calabaricus TaxID=27687 RepID=A0A8C4S2L6_ERPCA
LNYSKRFLPLQPLSLGSLSNSLCCPLRSMDSGDVPVSVVDDSPASSPSPEVIGRGRPAAANAARERSRVQTLRHAFLELQKTLPSVPPDTKLSKLDVLILATTYIAHLTRTLQEEFFDISELSKCSLVPIQYCKIYAINLMHFT